MNAGGIGAYSQTLLRASLSRPSRLVNRGDKALWGSGKGVHAAIGSLTVVGVVVWSVVKRVRIGSAWGLLGCMGWAGPMDRRSASFCAPIHCCCSRSHKVASRLRRSAMVQNCPHTHIGRLWERSDHPAHQLNRAPELGRSPDGILAPCGPARARLSVGRGRPSTGRASAINPVLKRPETRTVKKPTLPLASRALVLREPSGLFSSQIVS